MMTKKNKYNFTIVFDKLAELKSGNELPLSCKEFTEYQEINKLREIILDISEQKEQYFSTT